MFGESNPIIKFRKFWNKLNEEEQRDLWNVLTALRSYDTKWGMGSDRVDFKELTTARIRWIIFKQALSESLIIRKTPLNKNEIAERDFQLSVIATHFRKHFNWAMITLKKYKMWKD